MLRADGSSHQPRAGPACLVFVDLFQSRPAPPRPAVISQPGEQLWADASGCPLQDVRPPSDQPEGGLRQGSPPAPPRRREGEEVSEVLILQQGNTAERNPEDDIPCPCPLTAGRGFRNKNSGSRASPLNAGCVQVPSVLLVKVYTSPEGGTALIPISQTSSLMARQVESRGQIGQLDGEEPGAPGGAASTAGQSRPLSLMPRFGGRVLEAGPPPRRKSPHCRAAQGTEAVPPPWVQEAGMLVSEQVGRLHFPSLRTWRDTPASARPGSRACVLAAACPHRPSVGTPGDPHPTQRDPPPSLAGHWAQRSGLCSRNSPGPGGSPDPVHSHPRAPTLPMAQQRRGVLSPSGACAS